MDESLNPLRWLDTKNGNIQPVECGVDRVGPNDSRIISKRLIDAYKINERNPIPRHAMGPVIKRNPLRTSFHDDGLQMRKESGAENADCNDGRQNGGPFNKMNLAPIGDDQREPDHRKES